MPQAVFTPYYTPYYSPYSSAKVRTKRQNLTFKQRLEVVDFYHAHKDRLTLEQMVQPLRDRGFMTICYTTIKRCVNREAEDRAYVESGDPSRLNAKRQTLVTHPEVEEELVAWIKEEQERGVLLASALICEKARLICDRMNIPEERRLKFSKSWYAGFKRRHGLDLPAVTSYGELLPPRKAPEKKSPESLSRSQRGLGVAPGYQLPPQPSPYPVVPGFFDWDVTQYGASGSGLGQTH